MQPHGTPRILIPALKCILLAGCAVYVAALVWAAAQRVSYQYELEWQEGRSVCQAQRILEDKGIYCAPSAEFIPFIYTPLYFYASAAVARVAGLGFLPLRLLSLVCSVGCGLLIGLIVVRRYGAPKFFGAIAASFFWASFFVTGCWFDVARVDAMSLLLFLYSFYLFRSPKPAVNSVAAALVMFLAFFTKQTVLLVAAPLCLWCLVFRAGWSRLAFPGVFLAAIALSTFVMDRTSGGWYSYYIFTPPGQIGIYPAMIFSYWPRDILGCAAIAGIASLFWLSRGGHASVGEWCLDATILGSLLLASWFTRIHTGGYLNVLLPAYAGLAIFFGVGLYKAVVEAGNSRGIVPLIYLAAIFQFAQLYYLPWKQVPPKAASTAGDHLLETIASYHGDVLVLGHPWYAAMAGKSTFAQEMAIGDIFRASDLPREKEQLKASILRKISQREFDAIILDTDEFPADTRELKENYRLVDSHLTPPDFTPITGYPQRPMFLFTRSSAAGDRHAGDHSGSGLEHTSGATPP